MVKKSRKLDLSPIEEDETTIDLESPRARFMDKSPSALAKELGLSTNTVKNRIEKTGLDFSIKNDGNYQMYNYECLPILKAYLDIPRISSATDGDTPAFFSTFGE